MSQMHLGWHFCALKAGKPVLRDGTPLEIGRTYEHAGELDMCVSGYHDSDRVIEALRYAPGPYLTRTLASRNVSGTDKYVSRYRVALAGADVAGVLHEFAARIAYCALLAERESGREPDPRSWEAVACKMRWCRGEATDDELSAAWIAAESAARSAAWIAAQSAAESAARSAARSAAESVAWSAARSAVWSAAESAAWSAARSAGWIAAWSAARSAAESAADTFLLSMLPDGLKHPERGA